MPPFTNQFWNEFELFQRNIRRALRLGTDLMGQFNRIFPRQPGAEVRDLGRQVRVVMPIPNLARNSLCACRVMNGTLYVTGFMQQEQSVESNDGSFMAGFNRRHFLRSIPLPVSVNRKPSQLHYKNGLLILDFDKHDGPQDPRWYEFKL